LTAALEPSGQNRAGAWAFPLALTLLSPLLFLSIFFAPLAPIPLLYLLVGREDARASRVWAIGGSLCGLLITFLLQGPLAMLAYGLIIALPTLVVGESMLRKWLPDLAILFGLSAQILVILGTFALLAPRLGGWEGVKAQSASTIKGLAERMLQQPRELPAESKKQLEALRDKPETVLPELPGLLIASLLLSVTIPVLTMIRWNPRALTRRIGIHRDFLRRWKSPEWLVWPSLLAGAGVLLGEDGWEILAGNMLKPLLVIYFFHGMSILAFFLDSLRLRGPLRVLIYGTLALFLTPMVVSFGFFDLWFDFRARRKTSTEESKL
jgi:uncharacterized protein YybS (DUF2232 family)